MISPWWMVRTQWYNDVSPSWMVHSLGNSVGVAITQPRVEVRIASTLGIYILRYSYSVRVAISRRRYTQSDTIHLSISAHHPAASNAYG